MTIEYFDCVSVIHHRVWAFLRVLCLAICSLPSYLNVEIFIISVSSHKNRVGMVMLTSVVNQPISRITASHSEIDDFTSNLEEYTEKSFIIKK